MGEGVVEPVAQKHQRRMLLNVDLGEYEPKDVYKNGRAEISLAAHSWNRCPHAQK